MKLKNIMYLTLIACAIGESINPYYNKESEKIKIDKAINVREEQTNAEPSTKINSLSSEQKSLYKILQEKENIIPHNKLELMKAAIDSSKEQYTRETKENLSSDILAYITLHTKDTPRKAEEKTIDKILNENYMLAVGIVESAGNPRAISPQGARGMWQIMQGTWKNYMKEIDFKYAFDPAYNALAAFKKMVDDHKFLDSKYGKEYNTLPTADKQNIISAMYNAGRYRINKILKSNQEKTGEFYLNIKEMPRETQRHIKKINNLMEKINETEKEYKLLSYNKNYK